MIYFLFVAFFFLLLSPSFPSSEKLIVTSIFPIYDFTREITKDKAEVFLLLGPSSDPHHFEPRPKDLSLIRKADFLVYGGGVIDPWIKRIISSLKGSKVHTVDSLKGLEIKEVSGRKDPHVWLDLDLAQRMVDNILEGLCEKDRENCSFYSTNANSYKERLRELERKFSKELSECRVKTIVHIGHGSLFYLARKYGFDYLHLYPVHRESEPKPKDLKRLKEAIRSSSARYVFYERTSNQKLVDSVVRELNVEKILLDPLETLPKGKEGTSFIEGMEENLRSLKRGLECTRY